MSEIPPRPHPGKPMKPERKPSVPKHLFTILPYDDITIAELVEKIPDGIDPESVYVEWVYDPDGYLDRVDWMIQVPEPEEEFQARMKKYQDTVRAILDWEQEWGQKTRDRDEAAYLARLKRDRDLYEGRRRSIDVQIAVIDRQIAKRTTNPSNDDAHDSSEAAPSSKAEKAAQKKDHPGV